jgi:hypothetical protein
MKAAEGKASKRQVFTQLFADLLVNRIGGHHIQ